MVPSHLLMKYLFSTWWYLPDTVLSVWDRHISEQNKQHRLWGAYVLAVEEQQEIKYINTSLQYIKDESVG